MISQKRWATVNNSKNESKQDKQKKSDKSNIELQKMIKDD
jgi:hypothetical protein